MTRFARAKGSKASNERLPNEATPWHVMKQQLEENLAKRKGPVEKTKSAKELLAAKQDVTTENAENSWAVFGNISEKKTNKDKKKEKSQSNKVVKKQKTQPNKIEKKEKPQPNEDKKNQVDCSSDKPENNIKTKKKSGKRNVNEVENPAADVTNKKLKTDKNQPDKKPEEQANNKNNAIEAKTDKVNKKRKRNKQNTSQPNENQNKMLDNTNESQHDKDTLSKRQKRNMRRRKNPNESLPNATQNNNNVQNNTVSNKNKRKDNRPTNTFDRNSAPKPKDVNNMPKRFGPKQFEAEKKRKPPKIRDDKEHKRRKPDVGSLKMMINGIEVEVVKFDGFPVKKEDADRLRDLNKKMIMKGIPKKEIDAAMKLERRKAEKALARIRKCVCFHCRKAGHNLSDCPELGAEQAGTGICFKCGSTEHTHFECKVSKPAEFRYATCFICREQGHIAKQCPDNPKGIYPQGGGCNVCGDVTHLKKDCPDLIKEKEESTVTLSTITNGNLESLEGNENGKIEKDTKNIKVVKF